MNKKEVQEVIYRNLKDGGLKNYKKVGEACLSFLRCSGLEKEDKFEFAWLEERILNWMNDYDMIFAYVDHAKEQIDMVLE